MVNESLQSGRLGQGLHHEMTPHTSDQVIRKLKIAELQIAQAKIVVDFCRSIEVPQPTDHRWRQPFGGMQVEDARLLTQLENRYV